jgi:hypothetical protein
MEATITLIVSIIAIAGTLTGIGYNYRKVEELRLRVDEMEHEGSLSAQLTAKDVEWIKHSLMEIRATEHERIAAIQSLKTDMDWIKQSLYTMSERICKLVGEAPPERR